MKSRHQKMIVIGIVVLVMLLGSLAGSLPGQVAATTLNNRLERDPRLPNAADFDQDSFADLVVGVEWEDAGSVADAGAVNILYGSSVGISATGDQFWNQDSLVAADGSEEYDYFGQVLAAGDFDGDGAADLAVGVPGEDIGTAVDGGAVHVLYGSNTSGLVATGNQLWHQGSSGVDGAVETDDRFGKALAVGDFDGDGYDDLAVGAPYEDIDTQGSAGAVNVLYGSANGLTATGNQLWYEGYNGLGGEPEANDWFGYALAAGDFDLDGHDDLAVGLPGENLGTGDVLNAGRVAVIYGTQNGLSAAGYQGFAQGVSGVLNSYEENDHFGEALVTGDFDGDSYVDLAVGVPREDDDTLVDTGAVNVLYGSSGGLTAADNEIWFDSGAEEGDEFGRALAAGDFNGNGFDELAVGIPYEDLASLVNTGAVDILYGSSSGLNRRVSNDLWHQDRSGMEDGAEEGDLFGIALAAGDFDKDKYVDLAVGIRNEDVSTIVDTGAVHVLYGSFGGIAVTGNRFWHQDIPNVEGLAETNDHFGCALAAIPPERHKVYLPLIMR